MRGASEKTASDSGAGLCANRRQRVDHPIPCWPISAARWTLGCWPMGFLVYFRPNFLRAKERHRSTGISVETFDNPYLLVWEPLLGKPDVSL